MQYRAEIDGLRAIAVLPVIFFHAGFSFFPGGFVGVDIFFVISGYLITRILLQEIEQGSFTLLGFYERRARRILPALLFITLASTPFAWLWLLPEDMEEYVQSILAVLLFASNVFFLLESGYFESAIELKPLIHTWSLAVEEQFYIVYPPLLFALYRFARVHLVLALASAGLLSVLVAVWATSFTPDAAFYLIHTRAWELLLGALAAALLCRGFKAPDRPEINDLLCVLGLGLVVTAVVGFDSTTSFPGFFALYPTFGTFLLILFSEKSIFTKRALSFRPLVFVGLLSYSAYLWHQPMLAFARHSSVGEPDSVLISFVLLAIFPLAFISWKFVEQPFRGKSKIDRAGLFKIFAPAMGCLFLFAAYANSNNGLEQRYDEISPLFESYYLPARDHSIDTSVCFQNGLIDSDQLNQCLQQIPQQFFVLVGDSHAMEVSRPIREKLAERNIGLITFVSLGCLPLGSTASLPLNPNDQCSQFKQQLSAVIPQLNPQLLVLSASWSKYFNRELFDNQEGGIDSIPVNYAATNAEGTQIIDTNIALHSASKINELAQVLSIAVLAQIPEAGWDVPGQIRRMLMRGQRDFDLSTSYAVFQQRNQLFKQMAAELDADVLLIDPARIVCNSRIPDRCENTRESRTLYRDTNHPSTMFAELIAEQLINDTLE